MLRPTAVHVSPEKDHMLTVTFDNGETKTFDVTPYIKGTWYGELADEAYFSQAKPDGFTIAWPHGQDICPDELYNNSIII